MPCLSAAAMLSRRTIRLYDTVKLLCGIKDAHTRIVLDTSSLRRLFSASWVNGELTSGCTRMRWRRPRVCARVARAKQRHTFRVDSSHVSLIHCCDRFVLLLRTSIAWTQFDCFSPYFCVDRMCVICEEMCVLWKILSLEFNCGTWQHITCFQGVCCVLSFAVVYFFINVSSDFEIQCVVFTYCGACRLYFAICSCQVFGWYNKVILNIAKSYRRSFKLKRGFLFVFPPNIIIQHKIMPAY